MKPVAITIAAVAMTALSGSAFGADLARPARVAAAPAPVAVVNWTGPYFGLGLGARVLDSDWTTTETFDPIGGPFGPSTDPNASLKSTAFRVSAYAGYNWQINPTWLWGVEADLGWARNKDKEASRIPGLGLLNAGSFVEVEGDWDASARARFGALLTPTLLAYVTGGVAAQRFEATATCPGDTFVCDPSVGTQSFSSSKTRFGWTVGAGLEAMLSAQWMARLEYRYADFSDFSFVAIPPTNSTFGANASLSSVSHIVTLGLAWKL
jgi:outer membrane immunogenic protein